MSTSSPSAVPVHKPKRRCCCMDIDVGVALFKVAAPPLIASEKSAAVLHFSIGAVSCLTKVTDTCEFALFTRARRKGSADL